MLTHSEEKVALLFYEGFTRKEVAGQLHRAVSTIQRHEYNMYAKLHIHNRADLMRYLVETHFKIDTSTIRRRIAAIMCLLVVAWCEFSPVHVERARNGKLQQQTVRVARARRKTSKTAHYAA